MKHLFINIVYILLLVPSYGAELILSQQIPIRGKFIIRFSEEADVSNFLNNWNKSFAKGNPSPLLIHEKTLSDRLNVHLISYSQEKVNKKVLKEQLLHSRYILQLQEDRSLDFRTLPNDQWVGRQWPIEKTGIDRVWDLSTGGLTVAGDTIVIAILDQGFDTDHEDLQSNIWLNKAEMPFDGIDNDGNGLVDDEKGWNYVDDSPDFSPNAHGSSVAGIIGAKGNNDIGIAGINWNIKLMLFQISEVSHVISAYEYIVEQRQLYNSSDGQEGAFVVATNASFGADNVFCSREPIWGEMYNELGKVGILTGAGAANRGGNIDMTGDMPATCPSPYLLAVLNTNESDVKEPNSSYSTTHIDLASPGENSYTLKPFNRYGVFGDNSAAAPHLTGAIGLLYALACPEIIQDAKNTPSQTALFIKELLLSGVDIIPSLNQYTVSGGRLNVWRSAEFLLESCDQETETTFRWDKISPNPATNILYLDYFISTQESHYIEIYNTLGQLAWRSEPEGSMTFTKLRQTIDISSWSKGLYLVLVSTDAKSLTASFVKN